MVGVLIAIVIAGLVILNILTYINLHKYKSKIKWTEYKKQNKPSPTEYYEITNILCPDCGAPVYKYTGVALTTHPVKYRYDCPKCNWSKIM